MAAPFYDGKISGDAICGRSLLLVLFLAQEMFFLGTLVFPPPQTLTLPDSNSFWDKRTRLKEWADSYPPSRYLCV